MNVFNKPIRIAKRNEDLIILSVPQIDLKMEVNNNVWEFVSFLMKEEKFDLSKVEVYTEKNNITNQEDYIQFYKELVNLGVILHEDSKVQTD